MENTNNSNSSRGRFVTFRRFGTPIEAHVARTALENEGIESFVRDEHMIGANPLYSLALGGVRLDVQEADLARAMEVLGPEGTPSGSACPECGGETVPSASPLRKASAILTFLLTSIPLPFSREGRKCPSCGHSWSGLSGKKIKLIYWFPARKRANKNRFFKRQKNFSRGYRVARSCMFINP